jgi:sterol desaturase/sphingolipid hydroxylase (fatty acid hydroxylase superfamily)
VRYLQARITPLYSSEDHDLHHALFDINYGFPFPWLDIVHGTYQGTYLGVQYDAKAKRRKAA